MRAHVHPLEAGPTLPPPAGAVREYPLDGCRPADGGLSAGAFAVPAPRPAARPTLAFLEFLPGAANTAFSGLLLLGILDPADELVAGQRRDVLQASRAVGLAISAVRRSAGSLCTTPPGTRWLLTGPE